MNFVFWCIMCRCNGETVDHLFLYCGKANRMWSLVFRSFWISWVLPRSVESNLFGWWNWLAKHSSSIWNLAPLCLMWCFWRERNRRTFEDMNSSDDQLLATFSGSLFDQSRTWGLTSSNSLPSFLSSLLCPQFLFFSFFFLLFLFPLYFLSTLCFLHKVVFLNIYHYYLSKYIYIYHRFTYR